MKPLLTLLMMSLSTIVSAQSEPFLLAGTYTGGKSQGIYVFRFNPKTGTAVPVDTAETSNPSFLAVAPGGRFVYAVNEDAGPEGGSVTAFSFDRKTGKLSELNRQRSAGDHPCYVTVDKTGRWVIVGNYSSGTLAVLPIQKDGSLGAAKTVIRHAGSSVNRKRQEGPHVHATVLSPDNRHLFVPDLGIDRVMIYRFNAKDGSLVAETVPAALADPGAGPRHFTFHPSGKWAYAVNELNGTVTAFAYRGGSLEKQQTLGMSGPEATPLSGAAADIHVSPDGRFLYASDRDPNNVVVVYRVDPETGKLTYAGRHPVQGRTPRNFNFDPSGNFLLVANQNSDEIRVFPRDAGTGLPGTESGSIPVGKPVCIQFIR